MPFDEDGMEATEWARAWEPGLSNDIIILGKRFPLVQSGQAGKALLVRNYVDDPTLDFRKQAVAKGFVMGVQGPRKGIPENGPYTPESHEKLKEKVQFVVLHSDLTRHARRTFEILLGRELSTHFCINWNGVIYQYSDVAAKTRHGGETNDVSIGIDMNHRLPNELKEREKSQSFKQMRKQYLEMTKRQLQEDGFTGTRLKRELERYEWERPRTGRVQGSTQRTWGYTARQYDSLILLLKLFVRELGMAKAYPATVDGQVLPGMLEDEDVKQMRGFLAHWHLSDQRWDPGPAFDWERVLSGIQNEYNWFPLAWKPELILQGRDITKAQVAAFELFRNTERAEQGGTFPIGPNQTWHGGIHLFPPQEAGKRKRYAVHAMFDGVVVAAHFEQGHRELGHNNFVLLRHDIELPRKNGKVNEDGSPEQQTLTFFSLYMHLDYIDCSETGADALADKYERLSWPKRLHLLEQLKDDSGELGKALAAFQADLDRKREELRQKLENGDSIDAELEALIVDIDEYVDESEARKPAKLLTVGTGTDALIDPSKIAILVAEEMELKVSAGEIMGFVGLLAGKDAEELQVGVHVEVFSAEATFDDLDLDKHARHFRTPQRARKPSLTVETEDILTIFRDAGTIRPYRGVHVWPDSRIHPDEILSFFSQTPRRRGPDRVEAYREQLRRSITYHVSEWSDQVDWVQSLLDQQKWGKAVVKGEFGKLLADGMFSDEIRKFLPFIWLTEEVADKIGLKGDGEWNGRIYHYHPIHFVMWITYFAVKRNRVFRTSLSLSALLKRRKRNKALRQMVESGRKAKAKGPEAFDKWERRLERKLGGKPWRLNARARKNAEKSAEYDELRARIINGVHGEFETDEHDDLHGVVDNEVPAFSNPKEVLRELFDLPAHKEWKIPRGGDEEG